MVIVLSPAKTLDFEEKAKIMEISKPRLLKESEIIMSRLKKLSVKNIEQKMNVSRKLADLNYTRNQNWEATHCISNAKQAAYAFRGEAYNGLDIDQFHESDVDFAQKHFRILSGLYGVLRPMDLIQPYRLEMGTKIDIHEKKNLYDFWGEKITKLIDRDNKEVDGEVLINLASNEYFKAIRQSLLKSQVITPVFKELKNGNYKVISVYAKKARGLMTAWIIKNRITSVEQIKNFDKAGYMFDVNQSDEKNWVFTRG